jgi:hypothetical protein
MEGVGTSKLSPYPPAIIFVVLIHQIGFFYFAVSIDSMIGFLHLFTFVTCLDTSGIKWSFEAPVSSSQWIIKLYIIRQFFWRLWDSVGMNPIVYIEKWHQTGDFDSGYSLHIFELRTHRLAMARSAPTSLRTVPSKLPIFFSLFCRLRTTKLGQLQAGIAKTMGCLEIWFFYNDRALVAKIYTVGPIETPLLEESRTPLILHCMQKESANAVDW